MTGGAAASEEAKAEHEAPPRRDREASFVAAAKRFFARYDDGEILRWAFRGMLIGTISVLVIDYMQLNGQAAPAEPTDPMQTATPVLPPAVSGDEPAGSGQDPRRFIKTDEAQLRRSMQFTLERGGTLLAEGSIEPGTAARLAAELQARGEYVKTVSLNSPGGALDDAMEMGRLVRARGMTTEVVDGALCASSCPLFLAGGKQRLAGPQAAIGVHQFYAVQAAGQTPTAPAQAMSDAQVTTARINRHLEEMGVDPAVWLHALDTPPRSLYYFSADEMKRYKLATGAAKARTEPAITSSSSG